MKIRSRRGSATAARHDEGMVFISEAASGGADLGYRALVVDDEAALADAIEEALSGLPHLTVTRLGNTLIARTELGHADRVVLAGHIDTVPLTKDPSNLPVRRERLGESEVLWGRGTVDMKGGVAAATNVVVDLRENHGIFCSIVVYPVIPKDMILLRLIPTAAHSLEDVRYTVECFKTVQEKLNAGQYNTEKIAAI